MSKYGNRKTEYNGVLYDSKKEANRAAELDLLIRAGEVISWERQIKHHIYMREEYICTYIADFRVKWADGTTTVEDVKGVRTAVYRLKKKLVEALYGITITEK